MTGDGKTISKKKDYYVARANLEIYQSKLTTTKLTILHKETTAPLGCSSRRRIFDRAVLCITAIFGKALVC